jgi:type IV pilus assembly protein PilC
MAKAPAKNKKTEDVVWAWEGTDAKGKRMKGNLTAATEAQVKSELRRMGVNPLKIKKKPKPLFGGAGKKIIPKDIAIFMRQLATMMAAGVPLVQAFDIVGRGHENPKMQDLILTIKGDIEGGNTLADSRPASTRVSSRTCSTRSPPTRRRPRRSRPRSRRR